MNLCRLVYPGVGSDTAKQVLITATAKGDGDFAVASSSVAAMRTELDSRPWTWLRQVHGNSVAIVSVPGEHAGNEADAVVADIDDAVLAVQSADCAPVAFWSPQGPFGVAHAGWRGIEAGVIESTVEALRSLGATEVLAVLGPCIHPGGYDFGDDDLGRIAEKYGSSVVGTTHEGRRALNVPAAVGLAVSRSGARMDHDVAMCTAESSLFFSHRARRESGRQVLSVVRGRR